MIHFLLKFRVQHNSELCGVKYRIQNIVASKALKVPFEWIKNCSKFNLKIAQKNNPNSFRISSQLLSKWLQNYFSKIVQNEPKIIKNVTKQCIFQSQSIFLKNGCHEWGGRCRFFHSRSVSICKWFLAWGGKPYL